MSQIIEGKAILTDVGGVGVPSRKHTVFYNPDMKHQRDVFVAVVDSFKRFPSGRSLSVGLPMEASGVRAIRLSEECASFAKVPLRIFANDYDADAIASLRANLLKNGITENDVTGKTTTGCKITQLTADAFFAQSEGLDIIDIDPFGGPGPFLDGAIKRLSRDGLLCVTATDSAVLCGLYPDVCLRNYWSMPSHDMSMHEWAVRILVRYCQMIAAQYGKALIPVLCYKKDHYVRLYLQCRKSKELSSQIIREHVSVFVNPKTGEVRSTLRNLARGARGFSLVGPMYVGPLVDPSAFDEKQFRVHISDSWVGRLFSTGENTLGYFTVPQLCSLHKIAVQPPLESVLAALRSTKKVTIAYESLDFVESIKSDCDYKTVVSVLRIIGVSKAKAVTITGGAKKKSAKTKKLKGNKK